MLSIKNERKGAFKGFFSRRGEKEGQMSQDGSPANPLKTEHVSSMTPLYRRNRIFDKSGHYTRVGTFYRQCCFSKFGIRMTIFLNLCMVIINTFLIIYEALLSIHDHSLIVNLPWWYVVLDVFILFVLFVEIMFHCSAYQCHVKEYCSSGCENVVDIIVFVISAIGCALYLITRDIIRIIRCIWFFRLLYTNMIVFKDEKYYRTYHSPDKSNLGSPLTAKEPYPSDPNNTGNTRSSPQNGYTSFSRTPDTKKVFIDSSLRDDSAPKKSTFQSQVPAEYEEETSAEHPIIH
ncbi:hypothetical protein RFI_09635 [Reticulomyxa filosa]|uniref:Uncharacterized protein n=1 Tax=Reticulomyxa filosa TaxID=46433 RepID=X6NNJ4_RETFI|nr:hypothetical protein RFI_09635 [Reticulomyxa filosa]|eukprot:ETO27498.1 hypothetical protein RFI_09635 [Reticulomyxa filosa]